MSWTVRLILAAALAGPNGLQALHNPATEKAQQEQLVERLGSTAALPSPRAARQPAPAPTEADKAAAAWRADHLTCASRKGRTREQFETECKASSPSP